jgi:energy-coupling factor transporter ATP-binding protein EcfA2
VKIERLEIINFRGISNAVLDNLGDTIVIAGPNGSGKSCVFDAIRFLKSLYGGYQANEVQHFFNEFQINPANLGRDIIKLFNDVNRELRIQAAFSLADEEKAYLNTNADELLSELVWRSLIPEAFNYGFYTAVQYSAQFRDRLPEVQARVATMRPEFMEELNRPAFVAELTANRQHLNIGRSHVLSVLFNTYRPPHLGVLDYHGPLRLYGRENVQTITLSFDQNATDQRRQAALYNYSSKYGAVKTEMAGAFLRDVLSREAGSASGVEPLSSTLAALFEHFFPDKKFLGPQPTADGNLTFPVEVGGSIHDLDELSSGEKEVLYGYLRMRNSAPKHSIILLDEPELHLNPRLIRGLPQFYRKHLSLQLHNQLWLVSHSDALLREVVGKDGYNVYHMVPCTAAEAAGGQLKPMRASAELEMALIDMVGDVAAFRPGGKTVIFEGGGNSDFDQRMTAKLFPDFAAAANLVSGGDKTRVAALLEVLSREEQRGSIPIRFFAIADRDLDQTTGPRANVNQFYWDAYHIENYLLEPRFIAAAQSALTGVPPATEDAVLDELRGAARDVQPAILRRLLMDFANGSLTSSINTRADPAAEDLASAVFQAVARSDARFRQAVDETLTEEALRAKLEELRAEFDSSFGDGTWRQKLPGRDILKRFVSRANIPTSYEVFRNLLISQMADAGFQPAGMKQVIDAILVA